MESQLFDDLIEWPMITNLRKGDFFFSRNKSGKNLRLTTTKMTDMMKESAKKQGVDATLISAKSLRKALGTSLTHSDVPKAFINQIGRWSENSVVCGNHHAMGSGRITGTISGSIKRTTNSDVVRMDRTRQKLSTEASSAQSEGG